MHQDWLAGLLSGGQIVQALSERVLRNPILPAEYKVGRLQLENCRRILAPDVDPQSAIGRGMIESMEPINLAQERCLGVGLSRTGAFIGTAHLPRGHSRIVRRFMLGPDSPLHDDAGAAILASDRGCSSMARASAFQAEC